MTKLKDIRRLGNNFQFSLHKIMQRPRNTSRATRLSSVYVVDASTILQFSVDLSASPHNRLFEKNCCSMRH